MFVRTKSGDVCYGASDCLRPEAPGVRSLSPQDGCPKSPVMKKKGEAAVPVSPRPLPAPARTSSSRSKLRRPSEATRALRCPGQRAGGWGPWVCGFPLPLCRPPAALRRPRPLCLGPLRTKAVALAACTTAGAPGPDAARIPWRVQKRRSQNPTPRGRLRVLLFLSSLQKPGLPSFLHPLFQLLLDISNLSTWVSLLSAGQPLFSCRSDPGTIGM